MTDIQVYVELSRFQFMQMNIIGAIYFHLKKLPSGHEVKDTTRVEISGFSYFTNYEEGYIIYITAIAISLSITSRFLCFKMYAQNLTGTQKQVRP